MNGLPEPEVVRCSIVEGFPQRLAVLNLNWPESADVSEIRSWHFPADVKFLSPLPERFGIQVLRHGVDSYCLVLCHAMRETTSRPSPRPPTTGRHAGTRFLATDAAPRWGVVPDLRRIATWLRHHAPVGVTTAERFHATPLALNQAKTARVFLGNNTKT